VSYKLHDSGQASEEDRKLARVEQRKNGALESSKHSRVPDVGSTSPSIGTGRGVAIGDVAPSMGAGHSVLCPYEGECQMHT